jgi:hypothetical protein
MLKKWTARVTTGLVVAGMAIAAQSAPAVADQQAAPGSGTTTVAASGVDGSTVEVALTEAAPEAGDVSASCSGGWRGATAGLGRWAVSKSDCAWISLDSKKNPQHRRYNWEVQPGTETRICVQVQGHYYNRTKKKMVATWTTAGCGTSGTALVRWSGIPKKNGGYYGHASYPKVRAKVQPGFLGGAYKWK